MSLLTSVLAKLGVGRIGAREPSAFADLIYDVAKTEVLELEVLWQRRYDPRCRVALFGEYLVFLLCLTDRVAFSCMGDRRTAFINQVVDEVKRGYLAANADASARGECAAYFEKLLATRLPDYSKCPSIMGSENNPTDGMLCQVATVLTVQFYGSPKLADDFVPVLVQTQKRVSIATVALLATSSYKALPTM